MFQAHDWLLYGAVTLASVGAVSWALAHWLQSPDWTAHPLLMGLLSAILLVTVVDVAGQWCLLPFMRRAPMRTPPPGLRVAVATTFVPDREPLSMLEATVAAMVRMDYPHDTFVLDEGDDERVKALCKRLGARHFTRKHLSSATASPFDRASKSGNCNAFFEQVVFGHYDIVTTFDPDHVPEPDFLTLALGPFADPEVGYVQLPQAYSNVDANLLSRGAAEETYGYHSAIQMANHALGYPIIVGCHNTHRVTALQAIGGYGHHEADDLLTTARYQAAGWTGVYVPRIAARGLVPERWPAYLRQQRRWARSMLDIKVRYLPHLIRGMSQRAGFLSLAQGLNFVFKAAVLPILIGVDAALLASGSRLFVLEPESVFPWVAVLVCMLAGSLFWQRFYLDPSRERRVLWRALLLQFAKWPYMMLAIVDVALQRRPAVYETTPKSVAPGRDRLLIASQTGVLGLMAVAFLSGPVQGLTPSPVALALAALVSACAVVLAIDAHAR